jgi:hypothetical protein
MNRAMITPPTARVASEVTSAISLWSSSCPRGTRNMTTAPTNGRKTAALRR